MTRMLFVVRPSTFGVLSARLIRPAGRLLSALIFVSGSALGVSSQLTWVTVDPVRQMGYLDLDVNLGFPIGAKSLMVTVDCQKNGIQAYVQTRNGMPVHLSDWMADPTLPPALSKAGLVVQQGGTVTVNNTENHDELALTCAGGVLGADFSRVNQIGSPIAGGGPFLRSANSHAVNTIYSLAVRAGTNLSVLKVEVRVRPTAAGYVFNALTVTPALSAPPAMTQVLMSDGKALYPLYYNGKVQQNAPAHKAVLTDHIDFYVSEDPAKGGWRRTTYNYRTQVLRTAPVSKPNLPIRQ